MAAILLVGLVACLVAAKGHPGGRLLLFSPDPAICAGADGGALAIGVNGQPVGSIHPVSTNALRYNTDRGIWREYAQPFDAALLKPGENQIQLTVPAGPVTSGVVYDYLRLELDPNRKPPGATGALPGAVSHQAS